jgi:nitrite reductase/ring-hydroxylating ferredoxin subunit
MNKVAIEKWDELEDRTPVYALVAGVDLVITRFDDRVSVLYGRCAHRGALMADGHVDGDNLICGVHGWDYRLDTGVSEYKNSETLPKFNSWIEQGQVWVDEDEVAAWAKKASPALSTKCLSGFVPGPGWFPGRTPCETDPKTGQ